MYNFIDVNEVSEEVLLPSEALQINGEFIENLIEGYRTLHVAGREALSPELNTYETGVRDGSAVKSKRYPARIITVTYQIIAEDNDGFRAAFNQLGDILNVEDAELIFNDELDKFFIGTPSYIEEVEPGKNAVIGEFELFCADPFKYSVEEYVAVPNAAAGAFMIDYAGTYKSYPKLEAEFFAEDETTKDGKTLVTLETDSDCGFVAFFNDEEKIIQLGNPDEPDTEKYPKSQTLIAQSFHEPEKWGDAARDLWAVNQGISSLEGVQQVGTLGIGARAYQYHDLTTTGTLLKAQTFKGIVMMNYDVTFRTFGRTEDSVNVEVIITSSMEKQSNELPDKKEIIGHVQINGNWHELTIKKASEVWRGKTKHTVKKTIKLINIDSDVTELDGIKFKATRTDDTGESGILDEKTCENLKIKAYQAPTPTNYYLTCTDYDGQSGKWCGGAITRRLKADASGEVGAKDFTCTFKLKMSIGNTKDAEKQRGSFQCNLTNSSGRILAGVRIGKSSTGKNANFIFYVNGKVVKQVQKDLSYYNKYFGHGDKAVKTCVIKKSNTTVSFDMGGFKVSFKTTAASSKVTDVTFIFAKYSTSTPLTHNGLITVKFVKDNCVTWEDIPNKFSSNDVVVADCKNAEIYLNNILEEGLGALGNDWEQFYLKPGLNQISFAYSDWVKDKHKPNFKVRYREVFL